MNINCLSRCILFVGFTIPQEDIDWICKVDRNMPMQTHKFAWSLVHGLEGNGAKVDLLSSEPVSNFPSNPRLFFGLRKWSRENDSKNIILPFVNLLGLKHVTRFLFSLFLIAAWLFLSRNENSRAIVVHGVHSPFLYAALLGGKAFKVNVFTVVTDPPSVVLPGDKFFKRTLRHIDKRLIVFALRLMDGLVVLTRQLSVDLAPKVSSVIVEGMLCSSESLADDGLEDSSDSKNDSRFIVLYAGSLREEYGLGLLLKAFSKIKDPLSRLYVLGRGDYESEIKEASIRDSRIVFKGFCSQAEINNLYKEATILINPRPSKQEFTKYSFPSKTIEYMYSGTPVVTTRLPGIPEEYFKYMFVLDDESPDGLADLLREIQKMPKDRIFSIGKCAKEFILNNKTDISQGRRILDFLNQL